MVPEMEKKSERPGMASAKKQKLNVMAQVKKEKMNGVPLGDKENMSGAAMGSELVRDERSKSHDNDPRADLVNPGEGQDGDATEEPSGSSSSFGDTFSGDDVASALSEDEIDSQFGGGGQPSWLYPGYEEAFRLRKKKVTSHWRDFIRPLMVKCKWVELKMKQFQTQVSMYDRLLAQYDQGRQSHLETVEMSGSRSLRPHQIKGDKILQRKKRKRVEDTIDATPDMLRHNLFSHYENNRSSKENACFNNGYTNPVVPALKINNDCGNIVDFDDLLEFGDDENSLVHIFSKIEAMQARVHNMTTRVDKVINVNPGRFSLLNKLTLHDPSDSGASIAQDPLIVSGDNDKFLLESLSVTPQPAAEPHMEELNVPASVVTNELIVDSPLNIVEIADQPNTSDNVQDEKPLKKRPLADDLIVYKRGTISAKKRRMLPDKQSGINSNVSVTKPQIGVFKTQNEKSSLFLASRYSSLLNSQKKRGKRKGAATGKRLAKDINLTIRS